MNLAQLEHKLTELTKSELYHREHPNHLSSRYNMIEKTIIDGQELYVFKFDSIMNQHNICLNRESRFTPIPKHIHSVIELNYIYSGEMTQIIDGKKITLHKGDICILDRNTTHEILPLSENDIVITIDMRKKYFTASFLSRLSTQGLVSRFLVNALLEGQTRHQYLIFYHHPEINIHPVIQQLLLEYYDLRLCSDEIMDAYMIILFSQLLRIYQKQTNIDSPDKDNNEMLLLILRYMESNYQTVTLNSVAKLFGFHPNYLSSYIKKHTGKTFKELIITQRMIQAGFFLKNTDKPISEIAREIGYENQGFFYKKFQEYYHMSPVEYRKL
ncbi:MAG: AraC family transcriptional regulator [Lachnospiraceae bacterium]|nr:AraC family transcriptional regulator [Lachnospiraceae bacterium]